MVLIRRQLIQSICSFTGSHFKAGFLNVFRKSTGLVFKDTRFNIWNGKICWAISGKGVKPVIHGNLFLCQSRVHLLLILGDGKALSTRSVSRTRPGQGDFKSIPIKFPSVASCLINLEPALSQGRLGVTMATRVNGDNCLPDLATYREGVGRGKEGGTSYQHSTSDHGHVIPQIQKPHWFIKIVNYKISLEVRKQIKMKSKRIQNIVTSKQLHFCLQKLKLHLFQLFVELKRA